MRKLGRYEILGELGHGAMGVVYRALDPNLKRPVALKTITTGLADDPNLLQRFYIEAQSVAALQHPNIVTIYELGDEQNTPYIAMELIDGENLEQLITRRASVPLALKVSYALQACSAFDYAHKRGIIHRDIKPGNVMVNRESKVKVVDFGIARVLDTSRTQTGMLIGTFAYMSPERFHGEHADERSDIWSFGVLLYELLCGQRPFTGENPASLMHSICSQEPRPLIDRVPDCPPAIDTIISKILRKSAQDRFQSMEDLLLELEPVYKELQSRSIAELIDQSRQLIEKGEFTPARELLRESLKVDPANSQARPLLEKVNAELRRLLIRPKAQQHVDKGRALLEEGRIQEARAEVENALQLDSTFGQAQDLDKQIQRELDRIQAIAEWLRSSQQRLAEGMPDEAQELLHKVLEIEPGNTQALKLQGQVLEAKAERQRRLRLLEKMQEARGLWTQLNYDGCIRVLSELQKEFPGEGDVQRLLDTVREDQAEQYRQRTLESARNLQAVGNHAESRALLVDLQKQFPSDEEIPRMLEDIRVEETKHRRLQGLADVRICLADGRYDESVAKLTELRKEFSEDEEILELLETTRRDQSKRQRQLGIAEARNLLAARRYDDCSALVAELRKRFPNDSEIPELQRAIREERAEQQKQESLATARSLLAGRHYEKSIALLTELANEFAASEEVSQLLKTVRAEQAEYQRQRSIAEVRNLLAARRYEECDALLTKLQEDFPGDFEVMELQKSVRADQAEQQRQQGIAEAQNLLAARKYSECQDLLTKLRNQFPDDSDIRQIQKALEEDQAEQRKLESVAKARNLLASKNYTEATAILAGMGREFPHDEDIRWLLTTALDGQTKQQKQQEIAEARNLLAARRYDDCTELLADLEKRFPNDSEIAQLHEAVRENKAEQEKLRSLAKARNLIAQKNYKECVELLSELGKRFPDDGEIPKVAAIARDGLAEQHKLRSLAEARLLLEARRYDESIVLLTELKNQFPDAREIAKLLANASKEQTEQQKQQKLAQARSLLAGQRFSEALELLDALRIAYPKDTAVQKLRELVDRERYTQARSEWLQQELEALKKLVSDKKYTELLTRAEPVRAEFPTNPDLLRLIDFARTQQAQIDSEKRLQAVIDGVKTHARANRFGDAIRAADEGLKAFPENAELLYLRGQAEAQEKKQRARGLIEQRIREIKFKINRENFSEAIALAKETMATVGPDTDLKQLLNSAVVEFQAREKKRQQEQKLQEIRTMVESGNVDGAAETLAEALDTETLDAFDSRVTRVSQEIDAAKNAPTVVSPGTTPGGPANFSKEYALFQGRPADVEPTLTDNLGPTATSLPQASVTQPTISSQPVVPMPPQIVSIPSALEVPAVVLRSEPVSPAIPESPIELVHVRQPERAAATRTAPAVTRREIKRTAVMLAVAVGLIGGGWTLKHFGYHQTEARIQPNSHPSPAAGAALPPPAGRPATPSFKSAETQQQSAMAFSDQQVASGELQAALQTLQAAEKLNGPRTADIEKKISDIEQSIKDSRLRELRQQEEVLWQQSMNSVAGGRYTEARKTLKQILVLPEGGERRKEAQNYIDTILPRIEGLSAQALRSLDQGDFQSARQDAMQIHQKGGDPAQLVEKIDRAEGERFSQLETQFNQLKQRDDDATIQELKAMQPRFQALAQDGGSRSRDAQAYINAIPGAIAEVSGRIEKKRADESFQQITQRAKEAVSARDKGALTRAHSELQSVVEGNGPHAREAKTYLDNVNNSLAALNPGPPAVTIQPLPMPSTLQPSIPTPSSPRAMPAEEIAIRAALDQFNTAFQHRRARDLKAIWPKVEKKYVDAMNPGAGYSFVMTLNLNGKIEIAGDAAFAPCELVSITTEPGRQTKSSTGKVRVTLQKAGERWLIVNPLEPSH